MCKPKAPKKAKVPEPVIITNPLLDGADKSNDNGLVASSRLGRGSLRIPLSGSLGSAGAAGGYRPMAPGIIARQRTATPGVSPLTPYGTTIRY